MWIIERAERKAALQEALVHETQPMFPLAPLVVSGLVVSRADLVAALRVYVPGLADVRPVQGTDDFQLVLGFSSAKDGKG